MKNRKSILNYIMIGILCMGITGCGQQAEEETVIMVAGEEPVVDYSMVGVKRGDVTLTQEINAIYVQTKEQAVSFGEGGKKIEKVYVREGDYVKAGDILAEVSVGDLEAEIAALEYKMKKDALEKKYLDIHEEFELRGSYYALVYGSKCEEEDVEEQEERDEDIRESYKNRREDYADEAEFDAAELNELKQELASSRLYATMPGMVYTVEPDLEGSVAQKGEVIMTIIDGTEGVFAVEAPEYAQCFSSEDTVNLEILSGAAKGSYSVVPFKMDTWGDKQFFSIYDGPENDGIEMDTVGIISVVLDSRENVLMLPSDCVFKAEGKNYVYVLDENNMKNVCWVEAGLKGDDYTEIISGLHEGDMVVRR